MKGDQHPAPRRDQLSPLMASLLLYTPPLAWLVQLTLGEMLTSWPCFPGPDRLATPLDGYDWTRVASIVLLFGAAIAAWTAGFASWRVYQSVRGEREGGHDSLLEIGHGRTRFVALWGIYLGVGFGIATLATLAGFIMVPRCLG